MQLWPEYVLLAEIFFKRKIGGLSPRPHGPVTLSVYRGIGTGMVMGSTEGCYLAAPVDKILLWQHGKDEELTENLTSGEVGRQSGSVAWAVRSSGQRRLELTDSVMEAGRGEAEGTNGHKVE
jgi:hypothetical protein